MPDMRLDKIKFFVSKSLIIGNVNRYKILFYYRYTISTKSEHSSETFKVILLA